MEDIILPLTSPTLHRSDDNDDIHDIIASNSRQNNEAIRSNNQETTHLTTASDYQHLLRTVSGLHSKLQIATTKADHLESEHEVLKRNEEETRTELRRIQLRYAETRKSLIQRLELTEKREREIDEAESQWRSCVEQEKKILMDQWDCKASREQDTAIMRTQITEEVQKKCRIRVDDLQNEIEKWQELFHKERRKIELSKARYTALSTTKVTDTETVNKAKEDEVSITLQQILTKTIEESQEESKRFDKTQLDVKSIQFRLEKADIIIDQLRIELIEVSEKREKEEILHNEAVSLYETKVTTAASKYALNEADGCALRHQVSQLQSEIDCVNVTNKGRIERLSSTEEQLSSLQSIFEEQERRLHETSNKVKVATTKCDFKVKSEMLHLKQKNESLSRQNEDLEKKIAETSDTLRNQNKDTTIQCETSKRDYQVSMEKALNENEKLRNRLSDIEYKLSHQETEHSHTARNMIREREKHRLNVNALIIESEANCKKITTSDYAVKELKNQIVDIDTKLRDASNKVTVLQKNLENCEGNQNETEAENIVLSSKLDRIMRESSSLKKEYEEEKSILQGNNSRLVLRLDSEKSEIVKKFKLRQRQMNAQILKEKKRGEAYKEKALEAHMKNIHAKQLIATMPK